MKIFSSALAILVVSLPLYSATASLSSSGVRGRPASEEKARFLKEDEKGSSGEEELDAMTETFEDGETETEEVEAVVLEPINVSIQPAYHGIPVFLGVEMGWYEELGLNVSITVWDSGGPQVMAAYENQTWDFGVAGSTPNIIAGPLGISTVGISNDESTANVVVGAPGVTEFPPTGDIGDGMFAVSSGSTGDLVMRECLALGNVVTEDSNFLGGSQGEVAAAVESGSSTYGALWAPNSYTYLTNNEDAVEVCNGQDAGVTVIGGLMVRDEWADANPDLVARAVAVYLRGITMMENKAVRAEVLTASRAFYDFVGKEPTDQDIERDFLTRPTFNLDAQLDLMSRDFTNGDVSFVDAVYGVHADFLLSQGTIEAVQPVAEYLTDEYLQYISDDADLRHFSNLGYHATPGDME